MFIDEDLIAANKTGLVPADVRSSPVPDKSGPTHLISIMPVPSAPESPPLRAVEFTDWLT
jgi:hypothetical protein